tara:strand:- start:39829 stop:40338 length:510 start_codon:yes stop_codon:yes gene_type:complete
MAFNFRELNLSGVEVSGAAPILQPGRYVCEVTDAFLKPTKNGGSSIEITLNDTKGGGSVRSWVNVHVPISEQATRIGREQLKALLIYGGHSNPERPGDISSLKGLKVGVSVGQDKYTMDGVEKVGSKVKGFFDPSEIDPAITKRQAPSEVDNSGQKVDDAIGSDEEIPF